MKFTTHLWTVVGSFLLFPLVGNALPAYRKAPLDSRFFAEGAAFADLNRDGIVDAIAGPFWYAGPDFKERHEIYPPVAFDPLKYSDNFFTFSYDFNGDGWIDLLVIGFPGTEAVWFENPGSGSGKWQKHLAFRNVDNESPTFGRLFPGQPPVLICASGGRYGYAAFDAKEPTREWVFHPVTPVGPWQRFTHGLGFGDINGDGRNDLLEAGGWWEQPASLQNDPTWILHPFPFAPERGGAQMVVFDVNGDGFNDVVTARNAHGYGLSWYEQTAAPDGSITFHEHAITSTKPDEKIAGVQFSQPHALVVADIDHDGLPDLVTGKRWWAHGPEGDVDPAGTPVVEAFLLRRGAGHSAHFEPLLIDDASGIGTEFDTADANADGYPDFITSNKRGSFVFLSSTVSQSGDAPDAPLRSAEEERALFKLPPGFEIQLVASEPDIGKPLNLNFDARGRLWVSTTGAYPWPAKRDALDEPISSFAQNWDSNQLAFRANTSPPQPLEHGQDAVYVLSEFGADGRARKSTQFASGLNIPIGIVPLPRRPGEKGDSIISFSIPTIWRFTDTDGDGVADRRERLYTGFGFKDTHGMSSNYTYWVDGWIYGTHGFSNHSEVRDASGKLTVLDSGNTYRFKADGSHFEQRTWGQTNPFGLAFDPRGDVYTADSHSKPVYLVQPRGFYEGINKKDDGLGFAPAITADDHGSTAIAGIAYYAAEQFPLEYRGNLFNGNPVTRRVNRDRLEWNGSTPRAIRMPDLLSSEDPAFRPVQVKLGPDGALWISDFYNPIIGHYEVPLTHPSRDHAHGRIWRIVWRGLNGEIPSPSLPDLGHAEVGQLINKLSDSNLTVRTLAANELVDRIGPSALPQLKVFAEKVFSEPGNLAALPLANVLERLGGNDDHLLFDTLLYSGDDHGMVALRILAGRDSLGALSESFFRTLTHRTKPGLTWRAAAEVFASHPSAWTGPLILDMLDRTPEKDLQLIYGLRVALKATVITATPAQLSEWERVNSRAGDFLSGVCLAVPQASTAEYLLGYLERTQFKTANAGELARHAVHYLPSARYAAIEPLVQSLQNAPLSQRLALAEGLALAAAGVTHPLPAVVQAWMKQVLVEAASGADLELVRRGAASAQPIMFPEMTSALRRLAADLRDKNQASARLIVLRALSATPDNLEVFSGILNDGLISTQIRQEAIEALGKPTIGPGGIPALARALPRVSSDLALAIAIVLAKSDAGVQVLVEGIAAGTTPARLLLHGYVAPGLADRSAPIREKVRALTQNLPSENARLDSVIAARVQKFHLVRPDIARGAAVFAENCTACHKLGGTGASIGPSLDGLASRGVARLMEDILDPSRNIDPMFRLNTLVDRQGGQQTGMNLQDNGSHYLLTDLAGQHLTFAKDKIVSVTPITTSLMPGTFESMITEDDFFNLISFLINPSAK